MLFYSVSLLLVGRVGTGFQHDVAISLKKQFDKLKPKLPPVKAPGRSWS